MILNTSNKSTIFKILLVIILLHSLSLGVGAEVPLIFGDLEVSDYIEGLEGFDTSGITNIIYNESGLLIWKLISDTSFPEVSCYAMLDKSHNRISVLLNGTNESQILRFMLPSGDYKRPCDISQGECKNFSENGTYIYSILKEAAKNLQSGPSSGSAARLEEQPHYRCAFAGNIYLFKYEIAAFRDDPLIGISSHNWPSIRNSDSSQLKIPYGSRNVTFQFTPTTAKSYCILSTIYQGSGDSSRIYLGDRLWMSQTNWSGDTRFLYAPSPFPPNLTLSVDLRNSSAYAQVWLAMVSDDLEIKGRMSSRIDGAGMEEQIDVVEPDFLGVLELEKVVPVWPPLMIFDLKPENNSNLTSNEVTVQFRTTQESNSSVLIREEAQNVEIPPKTSSGTEHELNFDLKRNTSYIYKVESRSAYDQTISEERRFLVRNGVIFLGKPYEFTINRDYDQRCTLKIKNIDSKIHNVTIDATNPYDDLLLGFMETGTANETIHLSPGDERELELIVHAQDAMQEKYMISVKLSDLNETGLVDEAAVKIAVYSPLDFIIWEKESDPLGLTKTIRIENLGKIPLTDLKVRADPEGEIYLHPRINHYRLNTSEFLDFYAIPIFSENIGRISGNITASAGKINKSIRVLFECKGDSRPIKIDLGQLQYIVEIDDWYCTNRPVITRSFLMPPGFNESDVISATMAMNFSLQSKYKYLPHNVLVYLNGRAVNEGKLNDTIPSGRYIFNLSAEDFEYNHPEIGMSGNNELRIETAHLNQAHYLVSEKIIIRLCLKNLQRWVCAPSIEEAERILWKTPGIEPSYSNLIVNISSPQKDENLTVGQDIVIRASVYGKDGDSSGPQKHSEVRAVFESGYKPLILFDDGKHYDAASNDGIYANTWSPPNEGRENITVDARGCRQTRGSNNTWVLVKPPPPIVEKPNLLISALEMSKSAGTPGKVNISVEISNVGTENAGAFEVDLSIENRTIPPEVIDFLVRNSSRRISWRLDESELCGNIIRACADARSEIEETNEYDNCIQDGYCPSCDILHTEYYPVSVDIETTMPDNLRFWDKIGRELYYWVEKGSNIGRKYRVWIRAPKINLTGDSEISLKYIEGSEPSNFQDPSKVFTFFDDFQSIDDSKWSRSKLGEGALAIEGEGVRIHADARTRFQAYLQSVERFHPGVAVMFRANISEGQTKDVKAAGFIEDHNATSGSSIVWLTGGKDIFGRSKRGWMPLLQNYPSGYRRWEIGWLDSKLFFRLDTRELLPLDGLNSDYPSQGLPIEFDLSTDIAPKDADMILDWIAVREYDGSKPKVTLSLADSPG